MEKVYYYAGFAVVVWWIALAAHAVTTADFSRYQSIIDRKPFGELAPPATSSVMEAAAAESLIKDYEMKAIIDDGDKIQVCVLDKKTSKYIYLDIGQQIGGMQLMSVNYENEEAVLKMGAETTVIRLHPDKDKEKGGSQTMANAPDMPLFGMPRQGVSEESSTFPTIRNTRSMRDRKPFYSDIKKRGASPFQPLGTNAPFQAKGLESFFKPNTNTATPFVSPFRPQASPFKQVGSAGADNPANPMPAVPLMPVNPPAQDEGAGAAVQPFPIPTGITTPMQDSYGQEAGTPPTLPAVTPFGGAIGIDGTSGIEE